MMLQKEVNTNSVELVEFNEYDEGGISTEELLEWLIAVS